MTIIRWGLTLPAAYLVLLSIENILPFVQKASISLLCLAQPPYICCPPCIAHTIKVTEAVMIFLTGALLVLLPTLTAPAHRLTFSRIIYGLLLLGAGYLAIQDSSQVVSNLSFSYQVQAAWFILGGGLVLLTIHYVLSPHSIGVPKDAT